MKILIEYTPEDCVNDQLSITIHTQPSKRKDALKLRAWIKQFNPDKILLPFTLNMNVGE